MGGTFILPSLCIMVKAKRILAGTPRLVGGFVGDVAVDSSILCTLEGKCSIFDDSRVQFYELASFHGFQIYGVAVGCTLYSSGYGVTVVSTVTSCKYSGYSEQISKLFHCLFF